MKNLSPVMIGVAPNGARKSQADHSALPISPQELAITAKQCAEQGATMMHLHVRDQQGKHSLDPLHYQPALKAVRDEIGDEMIIQITTEAVGIYKPQEQIDCVRKLNPEAVSLSVKEFFTDPKDESLVCRFLEWMYLERIAPQYILYSEEDIKTFRRLQRRGIIQSDSPNVLLVLGRYVEHQQSTPDAIEPLVELLPDEIHWWLCAFGASEANCMRTAMDIGGHCRVGFENNLLNEFGDPAKNNASQVEVISAYAQSLERGLATAAQARQLMGVR